MPACLFTALLRAWAQAARWLGGSVGEEVSWGLGVHGGPAGAAEPPEWKSQMQGAWEAPAPAAPASSGLPPACVAIAPIHSI